MEIAGATPLGREKVAKAENQPLDNSNGADRFQRGKVELRGQDPRKPFFMALSVANTDGSIDQVGSEGCEAITDTVGEAIEAARDVNNSYPTIDVWIYRVVPVARVWRGKARITKF